MKRRSVVVVLVALCVMFSAVSDADAAKRRNKKRYAKPNPAVTGVNDPRYAALILNPTTGEVYHERNADVRRYPASLTKMMTLYLLFEALESGKTTLDARMDISELAARQPQTNLSLDAGDSIPVDTAIKALVVRSANDVSVVVAEALGGSVEGFAQMMTAKAKALGMRNTVFKNPNGLPNAAQVTTARDMAKLGIALKRDFPNYSHYFSTLQFSYEGVTYYTHNRVLMRYAGADGIKTGYINASGFNLVTSVERGGRPVVGVVLGGGSGGWRDNRMIQLLDEAYRLIASRGAAKGRGNRANLPTPLPGTVVPGQPADPNAGAAPQALPPATLPSGREAIRSDEAPEMSPFDEVENDTPAAAVYRPAPVVQRHAPVTAPVAGQAPPHSAPVAPVQLANPPAASGERQWGIQVGAFSSQLLAEHAARSAIEAAGTAASGGAAVVASSGTPGNPVYRARIENLGQLQAKKSCEVLIARDSPCFIFRQSAAAN